MQALLLLLILVSWFVAMMTSAGRLAVEDASNGVPESKWRGTSITPVFPIFPLFIWASGWFASRLVSDQIPIYLFYGHGALLILSLLSLAWALYRLRVIRRRMAGGE